MTDKQCKQLESTHCKSKSTKNGKSCSLFTENELIDYGLQGLVKANKQLVLLKGQRTILRRNFHDLNQVRLLGGGRAGFEPLYSGFVGPGMLTAACVGDKHSIPSVQTILSSLRELAHNSTKGIIVIIKNTIEEKLNFGLAVECAQREGILVKIVLAKDNCFHAAGSKSKGQVGIVFVYKIAAAMAENGKCLEEIHDFCQGLSSSEIATINIRMSSEKITCSQNCADVILDKPPLRSKTISCEIIDDLIQQKVAYKIPINRKYELVDLVLKSLFYNTTKNKGEYLEGALVLGPDEKVVLLFNNFGSSEDLEMNAIVNEIAGELERREIKIEQIYVGKFMRSNYATFSLTAMKVNENIINYLNYSTSMNVWPAMPLLDYSKEVHVEPFFSELDGPNHKELGPTLPETSATKIGKVIDTVCMALISCEDQINRINNKMVSGNIGKLVKKSAKKIQIDLHEGRLKLKNPFLMFKQLSTICSEEMSSHVGTYYGILLEGCSQAFIEYFRTTPVVPFMWVNALEKGIQAVEHYSEVKLGEKSLLDALYPMLNVLKVNPEKIVEAAEAAEMSSWKTVDPDSPENYPSVETHIVSIWSRALAESVNLLQREAIAKSVPSQQCSGDKSDAESDIIILD